MIQNARKTFPVVRDGVGGSFVDVGGGGSYCIGSALLFYYTRLQVVWR